MEKSELIKKLKPHYDLLSTIQDKKDNSFYRFFKNLTSLSVGLLGLLISLKPDNIPYINAKYCFIISLFLLALVCAFSLVTQFGETSVQKKHQSDLKEEMRRIIRNETESKSSVLISEKKLIYKVSEILTYVCLILSIIGLIFYIYFLEFPNCNCL